MSTDNKAVHGQVFKKGSTTYFNSSLFFPPAMREEVYRLYSFVRTADDYVDAVPQDAAGFYNFKQQYLEALGGKPSGNPIIDDFVTLKARKSFPDDWVTAFLDAMEADLHKNSYETLDETLKYIYGSAEVIGLFMASIMNLDKQAAYSARMLGRAMQYINFIRDINEDLDLGRRYLYIAGTSLQSLSKKAALEHPKPFAAFVQQHLEHYRGWQAAAEEGYAYIPKRYRVAIKTAADMYNWTAARINKDPLLVFEKKLKPAKGRIIATAVCNWISIYLFSPGKKDEAKKTT